MTRVIRSSLSILTLASLVLATPMHAQEGPTLEEITEAWLASPHADGSAAAFTHWNEDGEIPGSCAVCHSSTGVIDYLGGPMSTPGRIDHPVPTGTVVECSVCHDPVAANLTVVPFPSGATVDTFGSSATCAVCHQGRAAGVTVTAAVGDIGDDEVSGDLSFINVHFSASAASLMGSDVGGGYEYDGKSYRGQFMHVEGLSSCVDCHRPHSLEVEFEGCVACHATADSFTAIRTSPLDFDGDGDVSEGIAGPIADLHARLLIAIQDYASEVAGTPIVYGDGYPYFFIDSDGDGSVTEGEAVYPNQYQSWTPRLLRAAYNYQFVSKDTAIYVHNAHYALQLLYDSLEDLSGQVTVDMTGLARP